MLSNREILTLKKGKITFCLFLLVLCCFAFVPHNEIVKNAVFRFSALHVNLNENNLVLYKYKVYGTENSFNKNSGVFIEEEINLLKSKDEFIVVKTRGEYAIEYKSDYIFISEETVPDLKVEIYIAKNIDFGNNSLPCKTIIILLQKALKIIILILYGIILLLCFINLSRYAIAKSIAKRYKNLS